MPHCIIEYADTITQQLPADELVVAVNNAAMSSKLFDESHIKTRAIAYTDYNVGQSSKAFVHVNAKILSGRTLQQRQQLSEILINHLDELSLNDVAITVEITEMERSSYSKVVK